MEKTGQAAVILLVTWKKDAGFLYLLAIYYSKLPEPTMNKHLYLIVLLLLFQQANGQNCPGQVEAEAFPPKICAPTGTVTLAGNVISGNLLGASWSPSIGLSNPNSLSTTANIAFPITYTLTGKFLTNNNVINNGTFDGGNTGFFSNYINDQTSLWLEGRYAIGTNPNAFHSGFAPCGDHTTGSGNMMVVNGAGVAGQNVYCQVVNVNPNSDYVFSIWVASVVSSSPAILQFSVNGQLLGGTLNAPGANCVWTNFTAVWENPGVSTALICIVNQNTALSGNDFAIDDVEFLEICKDTAQVHVDVVNVDALVLPPPILSCDIPTVELDGSLSSSGPNITYEWNTVNGNIIAGQTSNIAEADKPGTYELTVIYDDGDVRCEKKSSINVIGDATIPVADAPTEYWISCDADTVRIDATNSTSGQGFTIFWNTNNGNIKSGINTLSPVVNAPGDYLLTILNNISGCKDTITVTVNEDQAVPNAVSIPADTITCRTTNLTLSGMGSSAGPNYAYQWWTDNGNILSGANSLNPVVDAAGTYQLVVHNTQNNCRDTSASEVFVDRVYPVAALDTAGVLNCLATEIELQTIYPPVHPVFLVEWRDTADILLSGPDSSSLVVEDPGVYYVRYTDPANGCTTVDSIEILQDIATPVVEAGPGSILSCSLDSLLLSGSGTGANTSLSFEWTTSNGNILSGRQTPSPYVDQAGLYELVVTDLVNGCSARDAVQIDRDADQPVIEIAAPTQINCSNTTVTIDASNSDQGNNYEISWTSAQGNIVSGQQSLQPLVDAAGQYQITIRDTSNGCESRESVTIGIDTLRPQVVMTSPSILNCLTTNTSLEATIGNNLQNYTVSWSSSNGNIINGGNTLSPMVDQAGNYDIEVQNLDNGCISYETVEVLADTASPAVVLAAPDTINCVQDKIRIQTSGSSIGPRFLYQWTDPDNNLMIPSDPTAPLVNAPGIYRLVIEDTINHCTGSLTIRVETDLEEPVLNLATPALISCINPSITLSADIVNGNANYTYNWNSSNGNIISGSNTTNPVVDAPGIYIVEVLNTANGCSIIDSITTQEDVQAPAISIDPADTLDCTAPSILLSSSISNAGNNFEINWTTSDGYIQNGQQSMTPEVSEPGTYALTVINKENGCTHTETVTVEQDEDLPVASIVQPAPLTCTTDQITLDGSASSQGPGISYSWSTSQGNIVSGTNSLYPVVDQPGIYELLVTNLSNACENTVVVSVEENTTLPGIDIPDPELLTCNKTTVSITGTAQTIDGSADFLWSTTNGNIISGNTTDAILVNDSGNYTLTITDNANGCTNSQAVIVEYDTISPVLYTVPPALLTCERTTVNLSVIASGSGSNFDYNWQTSDGNIPGADNLSDILVDAPGHYVVWVTDESNGCSKQAVVEVEEDVILPDAAATANDTITCDNLQVMLDGAGSSTGNNYSYQWTTTNGNIQSGNTGLTPTVTSPGRYALEVLNTNNGCTNDTVVSVEADSLHPEAIILPPAVLTCIDTIVNLEATLTNNIPNASFFWTSSNGNITGPATAAIIEANQAGNYLVRVSNMANGCYIEISREVEENVELPMVDAGETPELNCTDTIVTLIGTAGTNSGNYSSIWTTADGQIINGAQTLIAQSDMPGTYTLWITDEENGCVNSDQVEVIEDPNILTSVSPRTTEPKCFGEWGAVEIVATNGGTPPYQYSIDNGQHFQSSNFFNLLDAGLYELLVVDAKGCKATANFSIPQLKQNAVTIEPRLIVSLGDDLMLYPQTNINPNDIGLIQWTPAEGLSCTDCLNPVFSGTTPTTYTLYIEDKNGCGVTARTIVSIEKKFQVYIPSAFSPNNGDGINDVFYIFADPDIVGKVKSFLIFDRWGENLFENYDFQPNDPAEGWDGNFRGQKLNTGVYVYFAEIEFIDGTRKIFKGDLTLF